MIDGEVAICNEHGLAIFERLQIGPHVKHDAVLLAFDLIELNGQDLKREPLLTRKATLLSLLKAVPAGVQYVEHLEGDGAMIYRTLASSAAKVSCRSVRARRTGWGGRGTGSSAKAPPRLRSQKFSGDNWNV